MKELTLFDPGPQAPQELTDHQAEAFEHVRQAGRDGIRAYQLGKLMGAAEMYARSNGTTLLKALKKKRWVTERAGKVFVAADPEPSSESGAFGEFPEGF